MHPETKTEADHAAAYRKDRGYIFYNVREHINIHDTETLNTHTRYALQSAASTPPRPIVLEIHAKYPKADTKTAQTTPKNTVGTRKNINI